MGKLDSKYIEALKEGDLEAFNVVYEHYKRSLYFFVLKIVQTEEDAEEVVQDTFINAYQKVGGLKSNDSFYCWLFSIAHNRAQLMYRKKLRTTSIDTNLEELVVVEAEQKNAVENKDVVKAVENELYKLPAIYSQVAQLRYFEELSIEEIAKVLAIPEGTIKTRLSRIRKLIVPELERHGYSPRNYFGFALSPVVFQAFAKIIEQEGFTSEKSLQMLHNIHEKVIHGAVVTVSAGGIASGLSSGSKVGSKIIFGTALVASSIASVAIYQNIESEPVVIEDVSYYKELTNQDVEVAVVCNDLIEQAAVKIEHDDTSLVFKVDDNKILFDVDENGQYDIYVNDEKRTIIIDNIDKEVPLLQDLLYKADYLKLQFEDQDSIDYEKSYVEFQEDIYKIAKDGVIEGVFIADVKIVLYDLAGNMVAYNVNLSKQEK